MSDPETGLAQIILDSMVSGRLGIRVDGKEIMGLEADSESVKLTIPRDLFSGASFTLLRHRLMNFRFLRSAIEILENSSRRLDLFLDRERIFSVGKGVESSFGNEKLYLANLLRSLRS